MSANELPFQDKLGFCNVLISALGGDGANMAAKLLFKVGCDQLGFDGGYDAKYGSEKKGTPTDVSVRFCKPGTPIRQVGPTATPHILAVFHADMMGPLELNRGLQPGATCIVNSSQSPEWVHTTLRMHSGRVICVDASRIAAEIGSRLNMPMLALLAHELGFDALIKEYVAKQWPRVAKQNIVAFEKALHSGQSSRFEPGLFPLAEEGISRGRIGWKNMLNGGTVDALTHNTGGRDNRLAGRGKIPEFHPESCTSCGICLTVCSDPGGLRWQGGKMAGIDEAFCKGCMRCVEVCPENKKGKALTFTDAGLGD
ncbi:MAG: 2-oxoacid:acceptor oxidoreductase family protein [Planctomycetes bacterium]|nr:2-oxoacid:acceptor oxidoreductase family protein [Planctomycetota bacterium]MBI3832860.1 2-oxoacid:acceptor oxidoreductase family protein [Planctomycetota bacterium]